MKWSWRYTYVSSTHSLLPPRLNRTYDPNGGEAPSGVLLHSKFAATIVEKSRQERHRSEHFANSALYEDYYHSLACQPNLWSSQSTRYQGWRQLEALGLMSRGGWV